MEEQFRRMVRWALTSMLMTKTLLTLLLILTFWCTVDGYVASRWRTASPAELRKVIPARAPVIRENIETEFRTASGVTDGRGKFIAGVVMITAGYSAEGKYSHFFITQVELKLDDVLLQPGEYVFGYRRETAETIKVSFYRASTGDAVGDIEARVNRKSTMVRSLLISPVSGGKGTIQVGRFVFEYRIT